MIQWVIRRQQIEEFQSYLDIFYITVVKKTNVCIGFILRQKCTFGIKQGQLQRGTKLIGAYRPWIFITGILRLDLKQVFRQTDVQTEHGFRMVSRRIGVQKTGVLKSGVRKKQSFKTGAQTNSCLNKQVLVIERA